MGVLTFSSSLFLTFSPHFFTIGIGITVVCMHIWRYTDHTDPHNEKVFELHLDCRLVRVSATAPTNPKPRVSWKFRHSVGGHVLACVFV